MNESPVQLSFQRFGPSVCATPVVLSCPHAGRDYPPELIDALRVPPGALLPLEDRYVDAVAHAAHDQEALIVARRPRAWIDLNRDERERDPRVDEGAAATALPMQSVKLRSGLGLVPRRAGSAGDLWHRRFTAQEIEARIRSDHRVYHAAVAAALSDAHARFGTAVLLDIHSMPSLPGNNAARVVIGDRFGRSASRPYVSAVEKAARNGGLRVAVNEPYAGGHILDRHGNPARQIHAIQIEFDRTLYLDTMTLEQTPGVQRLGAILRAMIDAVVDTALPLPAAAE